MLKLYYIGQMFRYDRPQAGRYREFWQVGVEVFGADNPAIDAEVVALGSHLFSLLGLKDLTLRLNSIGDNACRPKYVDELKAYAQRHADRLCVECQSRYVRNPLRVLDCKNGCRVALGDMPKVTDYWCAPCREHFATVKEYLDQLKVNYEEDPYLVRGLDYYSRTTFEFMCGGLGAQDAIGGAGRYDYLVGQLGAKPTPGIGFALGVDRIILALKAQNVSPPVQRPVEVYIAVLGESAMAAAFGLAQELRGSGIRTDLEYNGRSLKAQMKTASKLDVRYVVMIGENELNIRCATVREMESGDQRTVAFDRLCADLSAA